MIGYLSSTYNLARLCQAVIMLASMEGPDEDLRIELVSHNLYRTEDAFYGDGEQDQLTDHKK